MVCSCQQPGVAPLFPRQNTMRNLYRAIICSACSLELSSDGVVDPDSAIKALEEMAATLQSATREEKEAFVGACADESSRLMEALGNQDPRVAEFLRTLPMTIGIEEGA